MENASDSLPNTPNKHTLLFWSAIDILAIPSILSIGIMTSPSVEYFYMDLTGTNSKLELLKFIGWIISGLIAIFGVIGLFQRAEALDKQNKINEKNHKQRADEIEKGQIQERFKVATDHLSSERVSARIAAFYEFYRLAKTESEPDLKDNIFDILCAHIRQTTKHKDYTPEEIVLENRTKKLRPTEEVQSLLNILFKPPNEDDFLFSGLVANLEGANLRGANLRKSKLQNANLINAILINASMSNVNLQNANLFNVNLQNANLLGANLQEAKMWLVDMRGAYLRLELLDTELPQEKTREANLQGAILQDAKINRGTKGTKMPKDWENVVGKIGDKKTGVLVLNDKEEVIERP